MGNVPHLQQDKGCKVSPCLSIFSKKPPLGYVKHKVRREQRRTTYASEEYLPCDVSVSGGRRRNTAAPVIWLLTILSAVMAQGVRLTSTRKLIFSVVFVDFHQTWKDDGSQSRTESAADPDEGDTFPEHTTFSLISHS